MWPCAGRPTEEGSAFLCLAALSATFNQGSEKLTGLSCANKPPGTAGGVLKSHLHMWSLTNAAAIL